MNIVTRLYQMGFFKVTKFSERAHTKNGASWINSVLLLVCSFSIDIFNRNNKCIRSLVQNPKTNQNQKYFYKNSSMGIYFPKPKNSQINKKISNYWLFWKIICMQVFLGAISIFQKFTIFLGNCINREYANWGIFVIKKN